jgi:hypothetical protein
MLFAAARLARVGLHAPRDAAQHPSVCMHRMRGSMSVLPYDSMLTHAQRRLWQCAHTHADAQPS